MNPEQLIALVPAEGAEGRIEAAIAQHLPADERYQAGPLAFYVARALGLDREDWPTRGDFSIVIYPDDHETKTWTESVDRIKKALG